MELIKKACASVGGSYYNGACRCSDGSLKNMNTGECVNEADAPLVPINFNDESERREMADIDASPRMLSRREAIAVTTRDEINARLEAGREVATGGPAIASTRSESTWQNWMRQESDRLKGEADAGAASDVRDSLRVTSTATPTSTATGRTGGSTRRRSSNPEATGTTRDDGQEQAGDTPRIPAGLILAGLSFLLFRS